MPAQPLSAFGKSSDKSDVPELLLRMVGITKRYGGTLALSDVSFDLAPGEVRALVGENGAGKSTLMRILSGAAVPDEGTIALGGRPLDRPTPAGMIEKGLAVIYQELAQAPHLTVAENVWLGRLPRGRAGLVNWGAARAATATVLGRLGAAINPDARLGRLSVAQRQMVEIARALARDSRLIVLDEPSAVLGEAEIERLFTIIRRLRSEGVAFVYVSHRLDEVFRLCDSVTVLRDGRHITTRPVAGLDRDGLVQLMVGRELADLYPVKAPSASASIVLEARGLTRAGALHDVSLHVGTGEIVGLCGLSGSGRSEVLRVIAGADPIEGGELAVEGRPVRVTGPRDAIRLGLGLVPEDRKTQGVWLDQSVAFNLTLSGLAAFTKAGFIDARGEAREVARRMRELRVKAPGPSVRVGALSGGNQQKCAIGRQLVARSRILLVDEPTRGVDVGARREIYDLLVDLAREGAAILMVSSEIPEIIGLCHRAYVMREGRVVAHVEGADLTEHQLVSHAMQ